MAGSNQSMRAEDAGANVLIRGHKCHRCDHEWRPHDLNEIPITCPKCKSPYWQKPKGKKNEKVK